ncbi:MAG: tol-pal system protein YbgF [Gammaproteobacteria bacterium]|nr:tol-pal system protein YbgF [Gammaproteobacteria bacterium]
MRRLLLPAGLLLAGCASVPDGGPTAVGAQPVARDPASLVLQLQELQDELKALRNQIEIQGNQLQNQERRQRELYDDLDFRLRARERDAGTPGPMAASPAADTAPTTAGGMAVPAPGPTAPAAGPVPAGRATAEFSERQAYEKAFDLLKQSRYEEAIAAFRAFLATHPSGLFAASAQYWIAEAYYVNRDFTTALVEFQRVVNEYPNSPKAPDALLKVGYSHLELGQADAGRQVLTGILQRYPGTRVAISAEARLKKENPTATTGQ